MYIYIGALCFRIRGHIPNCVRQGLQKTMDFTEWLEKKECWHGGTPWHPDPRWDNMGTEWDIDIK